MGFIKIDARPKGADPTDAVTVVDDGVEITMTKEQARKLEEAKALEQNG